MKFLEKEKENKTSNGETFHKTPHKLVTKSKVASKTVVSMEKEQLAVNWEKV